MSRYNGYGVSKLVLVDAAAPIGFTAETANTFLKGALNDRPKMMQDVTDGFFFQYIYETILGLVFSIGITSSGLVNSGHHHDTKR